MLLWTLALLSCRSDPPERPAGPRQPHVILVTLDTTRADALGVYGAGGDVTPRLDALAASGVRFEWALSHVPSTLSSHASVFTGLDPHGHGVPRNGFPLAAEHDTLAERLAASGYDTRAVIAASVLDHSMGLDAGFAHYDDDVRIDQVVRYESRADAITARALVTAETRRPDAPLFLWVHYFDAHHPYEAPAAVASRFVDADHTPPWLDDEDLDAGDAFRQGLAGPQDLAWLRSTYQAEVAWMDSQIGRLLDGLSRQGLLEDAVIVVAGDHGEMFGEEPDRPMGHSFDIDLAATHVPLIVARRGPGSLDPRVVEQPVKLSDVGPTVLALAGVRAPLGTAQDLGPLLRGEPLTRRPIFLEATRGRVPRDGAGWNNLPNERGIVTGDALFIRGPYGPDRAFQLDPAQTPLDLDGQRMATLARELEAWDQQAPPYREAPTDSPLRAALEALGYVDPEDP